MSRKSEGTNSQALSCDSEGISSRSLHIREQWTGKLDFLFSSLGYAVGLGNVWRFPYLAYSNGGGAFFIPYFTMVIFVGTPIFVMETIIGQFSSCGPTTCWDFCPFFKGCGFAMVTVSFLTCVYYNMIIAWAFYYVYASLESPVPWYTCGKWSTKYCVDRVHILSQEECHNSSGIALSNGICQTRLHNDSLVLWNRTLAKQSGIALTFPAKEYFERRVLGYGLGNDITNIGPMRIELILSLTVAWVIVIVCLAKGIRVSGKIVYLTATSPYLMLIILFLRGIRLPGAGKGIQYYILPNMSALSSAKIWQDAAVQIFFSLSSSYGGIIALSSYNKFNNNILRDSLVVCVGNSATSIFAGFIVFSFLGFLSFDLNVPIHQVAEAGPALAFTIYPFCLTKLPGTNFWSVLFFVTIILLGIDSQFVLVETVITGIIDMKPRLREQKWITVVTICGIMFFLGLPLTCNGGLDVMELMDTYSSGWNVICIALCECTALHLYGLCRFIKDLEAMIGQQFCLYNHCTRVCRFWWISCWGIITPSLLLFVFLFSAVNQTRIEKFPAWVDYIGWGMLSSATFWILVIGAYVIVTAQGTIQQRIYSAFVPTIWWGPALYENRITVAGYVEGFTVDPEALTIISMKNEVENKETRSTLY
uniref:Transporter n=1 Tax=Biomphalaria glabrata TaxID=6526 RepID=A0A2C9JJV6_BIOGL